MSTTSSSDTAVTNGPQDAINDYWDNLITKKPAKVTKIFPASLYTDLLPPKKKPGTSKGKNAADSYEAAAAECRARVKRIVRECHRINVKYTDPDFNIEDLWDKNCLQGLKYWYNDKPVPTGSSSVTPDSLGQAIQTLVQSEVLLQNAVSLDLVAASKVFNTDSGGEDGPNPGSVHRVDWIFEDPKFEIDGFDSSDVVQGYNGDCWLIAAIATICSNPDLIKKVCVARDEECGVYGFVFYRDGEWISTVVDDMLYLKYADFDAYGDKYDPTGTKEKKWKKNHQTGSEALYFASCTNDNETWLPLLEKAYAKVHGDYGSIEGGWSGEGVEDLTGGVTSKVLTDRVLSKQRLWEELLQVNKQFLFSASSPGSYGDDSDARRGLALSHAYSVIKVTEEEDEDGKKHRLVLIRNPWGKRANASMGEWTGPWSDGSAEWNAYWLKKLGHKFGDDGLFWMSYDDLLKRFDLLDRTRLFDADWTVVQSWTSVSVGWVTGYLNTKFSIEIKKSGPTVFVLQQLDDRYFRGLEGKYGFDLHFILQEKGSDDGDHIIRAKGAWFGNRSISAEVDLEAGIYEVVPKIEATRNADAPDVQDVVIKVADKNPQKLRQIGLNYDVANARGFLELTDEEQKAKDKSKKETADKKTKKQEAEAKEKEAFEAWKKEEKAEYEAWKRHKNALGSTEKKEDTKSGSGKQSGVQTDEKAGDAMTESERAPDAKSDAKTETKSEETQTGVSTLTTTTPKAKDSSPSTVAEEKQKLKEETVDTGLAKALVSQNETKERKAKDSSGDDEPQVTPESSTTTDSKPIAGATGDVPATMNDASAAKGVSDKPAGDAKAGVPVAAAEIEAAKPEKEEPTEETPKEEKPAANTQKPWNAVCVLGLRVYSKDPEVSIKFVKPKSVGEGALLDVGGGTAAGATM